MLESAQCGLYVHIPFCVKKCNYCDFLSKNESIEVIDAYIAALKNELDYRAYLHKDKIIETIYLGGGTPSCISQIHMQSILDKIFEVFNVSKDAEITIEVNPGTVSIEKLSVYKNSGINRISFGLQSADNNELKILGRIHTYEEFVNNYYLAREIGFNNINIDLMSAIPCQTLESYKNSIYKIIRLNPEHISSYSLIIEKGTYFYNHIDELILPSEDDERNMYYMTSEYLSKAGYKRYEISNYCKAGYESKHNSSYWTGVEYIGAGLGASSYIENERFKNTDDIKKYIMFYKTNLYDILKSDLVKNNIIQEKVKIEKKEMMEEFMFLGLRMTKGISKRIFEEKFGKNIYDVYGNVIKKYKNWKMITDIDDNIKLTKKGIDLSNTVLSEFIL